MKKEKIFHDLSLKKQNVIRRKYKTERFQDYSYSIKLYILYVILGVITIIGLFLINKDLFLGCLLITLGFIFMIIDIYFLNKSNEKFYNYLNKIGYIYDKKKR